MKRLLLILILLATPAFCVPTLVAGTKAQAECTTSVSTCAATYAGANTAGNEDFALVRIGTGTPGTVTVSDTVNAGNWNQSGCLIDATNGRAICLFYRENIASGTPTVTASWTAGTVANDSVQLLEYSGMATSSSQDIALTGTCPTAGVNNPNSGNITTTNAADLLLGGFTFSSSATLTVSSESASFTAELNDTMGTASHPHGHFADRIVAATGTYNYQPTLSAATQLTCIGIAAFKGAAAGGATCNHTLALMGAGCS